jgi:hypothetical protein
MKNGLKPVPLRALDMGAGFALLIRSSSWRMGSQKAYMGGEADGCSRGEAFIAQEGVTC